MRKQIIFSIILTIIAVSAQNINAAECQQCMVLRNDLLTSLTEQTKLTTQNLEFAQINLILLDKYDKLEQQFDGLAHSNNQLNQALFHVMSIHHPQINSKGFAVLPNKYMVEHKGFYFTNNEYKTIYLQTLLTNKSLRTTLLPTDQSVAR